MKLAKEWLSNPNAEANGLGIILFELLFFQLFIDNAVDHFLFYFH